VKFQPDTHDGFNAISRYAPEQVSVGGKLYSQSILIPWKGEIRPWSASSFAHLQAAHFLSIVQLVPEVVIFGSGAKLRFPAPKLLATLMEQRIGLESMDNAAACRTYNVLVSEGRRAVLALLMETEQLSQAH
jgi:uncharacterized protein